MISISIKYLAILTGLLTVILLADYSIAEDIDLGFDSINIETIPSFHLLGLARTGQDYQIQGPYQITINNIKKSSNFKLNFTALNRQSYQMITDQIMFQYRCVSVTDQGNWSQWFYLKSLPLTINFRFAERVVLYLQLKAPQSLDIQRGVYQGEFSLKVE